MIGYYVHHQGRGHLHRAQVLCASLPLPVTGLSSLARPAAWRGEWEQLPSDDDAATTVDVTARGALHWVPRHDTGVSRRAHALSAWLTRHRPKLLVVDVSVEAALLARLHGVPVISVVLPGRRDDGPHLLGYQVSDALVAAWPDSEPAMTPYLPQHHRARLRCLGGVSRLADAGPPRRPSSTGALRHVVVLQGHGDTDLGLWDDRALAASTPGWQWTVLGGATGGWVEDPAALLADADVVVTHAGQSAIADVAALRRPAVVIPAPRPFEEQLSTARTLDAGTWPVVVLGDFPSHGWAEILERAATLDGGGWSRWCDGRAPQRFAAVVDAVVRSGPDRLEPAGAGR